MAQETSLIFDLAEMAAAGLAKAREQFERVTRAIAMDQVLSKADTFVLDYPDPTRADGGGTADVILNDLVPALQVNSRELELARERLLRPLTMMLARGGREPGLDLRRRNLRGVPEPRVLGDGHLVYKGEGVRGATGPALDSCRVPARRDRAGNAAPESTRT